LSKPFLGYWFGHFKKSIKPGKMRAPPCSLPYIGQTFAWVVHDAPEPKLAHTLDHDCSSMILESRLYARKYCFRPFTENMCDVGIPYDIPLDDDYSNVNVCSTADASRLRTRRTYWSPYTYDMAEVRERKVSMICGRLVDRAHAQYSQYTTTGTATGRSPAATIFVYIMLLVGYRLGQKVNRLTL